MSLLKFSTFALAAFFVAACGNGLPYNDSTSSENESEIPAEFDGNFSGSRILQSLNNRNTVRITWTLPESVSHDQGDLEYTVYISTLDNMRTVEAAEANGTNYDGTYSRSSATFVGLRNNTPYYFTVVVVDPDNNKAVFQTVAVTTGQGPEITSFTTSNGVPTVVGTDLDLIWSGSPPVFYDSQSGPNCENYAISSGLGNLSFIFGVNGRTATSWTPGNNGSGNPAAGTRFPNTCMGLCSSFDRNLTSLCTPAVRVIGD